jgi:hypothetical protein
METKPKYELTEEHRAQLKPWSEIWIKNAMSTERMTADNKIDSVKYINEMYLAAKLEKPKHIFFVPSPFAATLCGGFAAAISQLSRKSKYTIPEMVDIVLAANISKDDHSKWFVTGYNLRELNTKLELGDLGLECIRNAHHMWNGGNQWSGWVSYISFFRHIAKLDIDYSKWDSYEQLCKISGPRILHADFCIVSDRPTKLQVNATNQPHCTDGPFCAWSDGSKLYAVNGVRVPAYIIESPDRITVDLIESQSNVEVRRVMLNVFGTARYLLESKSEIVNKDDFGTLYRKEIPGDEPLMMVQVVNSTVEPDGTFKDYFIRVNPNAYGGLKTARAAVASTFVKKDGSMLFASADEYDCEVET